MNVDEVMQKMRVRARALEGALEIAAGTVAELNGVLAQSGKPPLREIAGAVVIYRE